MIELAKGWPKLLDVAGSDMVRQMDWPGSEQIADKLMQGEPPPPLKDGEGPNPGQMRGMIQAMQGQLKNGQMQLQALYAHAQQLDAENRELKVKAQSKAGEIQVDMAEIELKRRELAMKEEELRLQREDMLLRHEAEMAKIRAQHEGDILELRAAQAEAHVPESSQ